MPIYVYRCTKCGHAKEALQRLSDPPLTVCPACGEASLQKQVTAAGFQLKGSGWYVTDFRGDGKGKTEQKSETAGEAAPAANGDAASGGGKADTAAPAPVAAAKADAAPPKQA